MEQLQNDNIELRKTVENLKTTVTKINSETDH